MVVGIQPRWPETGYGYIEFPQGHDRGRPTTPSPVRSFHEKPELREGEALRRRPAISTGTPACSSGARTCCWIELRQHLPKTATMLASLPAVRRAQVRRRAEALLPLCENISIDYAVLEKAKQVAGIRRGGFRLERRGKLERRLRTAAARRPRERRSPTIPSSSTPTTTSWTPAAKSSRCSASKT